MEPIARSGQRGTPAPAAVQLAEAIEAAASSITPESIAALPDATKRAQLLTSLVRAWKLLREPAGPRSKPRDPGKLALYPELVPLSPQEWEARNPPRFRRGKPAPEDDSRHG